MTHLDIKALIDLGPELEAQYNYEINDLGRAYLEIFEGAKFKIIIDGIRALSADGYVSRNAVLEEAAKCAMECMLSYAAASCIADEIKQINLCRRGIAGAIRALAAPPPAAKVDEATKNPP